jgi:hypothetical protein
MAKKKAVKEEVEEEIEEVNEFVLEAEASPATSEAITAKALSIIALFGGLEEIEGEKINPADPYHQIVAAYYVGRKSLLRK